MTREFRGSVFTSTEQEAVSMGGEVRKLGEGSPWQEQGYQFVVKYPKCVSAECKFQGGGYD